MNSESAIDFIALSKDLHRWRPSQCKQYKATSVSTEYGAVSSQVYHRRMTLPTLIFLCLHAMHDNAARLRRFFGARSSV